MGPAWELNRTAQPSNEGLLLWKKKQEGFLLPFPGKKVLLPGWVSGPSVTTNSFREDDKGKALVAVKLIAVASSPERGHIWG